MNRGCVLAVLLCACAETRPAAPGVDEAGSNAPQTTSPVEDVAGAEPSIDREPVRQPDPDPGAAPDSDPDPDRGVVAGVGADPDPAVVAVDVPLPAQLECVSAIDVPEGHEASSWRGTLSLDPGSARISLVSALRFDSHDGAWSQLSEPSSRDVRLHAIDALSFAGEPDDAVALTLTPEQPFFRAALEMAATTTDLLCWDRIAIFGSSWSAQPVALARFDPERGACVDHEGRPAELNALPLEFVLDTHDGECADLRGAQLNAGDYGDPDIFLELRGADLTDASLQFATLSGSFEGARLAELDYGYASVTGSIDDSTVLPVQGECVVTASETGSDRVTCAR